MIKLTEDVLEKLDNEVDLSQLLYAVDDFAELRESASDGRNELLQLYELLRRLIQEERTPGKRDGEKIFELADSIECTLSSVVEMAKKNIRDNLFYSNACFRGRRRIVGRR